MARLRQGRADFDAAGHIKIEWVVRHLLARLRRDAQHFPEHVIFLLVRLVKPELFAPLHD